MRSQGNIQNGLMEAPPVTQPGVVKPNYEVIAVTPQSQKPNDEALKNMILDQISSQSIGKHSAPSAASFKADPQEVQESQPISKSRKKKNKSGKKHKNVDPAEASTDNAPVDALATTTKSLSNGHDSPTVTASSKSTDKSFSLSSSQKTLSSVASDISLSTAGQESAKLVAEIPVPERKEEPVSTGKDLGHLKENDARISESIPKTSTRPDKNIDNQITLTSSDQHDGSKSSTEDTNAVSKADSATSSSGTGGDCWRVMTI